MSYEEEQQKRLERIGPNPEAEAQLREAEKIQDRKNRRFTEILNDMKSKVPDSVKDMIRDDLRATAMGIDPAMLDVEIAFKIEQTLKPIALQQLESEEQRGKKEDNNPFQQMNKELKIQEWSQRAFDTLPTMVSLRDNAKQKCAESRCLLNPLSVIALSSTAASFNAIVESLNKNGINLTFFPEMPMTRGDMEIWVRRLLNNEIFTDEQIAEQRAIITRYLSRPVSIPFKSNSC